MYSNSLVTGDSPEPVTTNTAPKMIPCDNLAPGPSSLRKYAILLVICTAQFMDIFGACAVIVSLPTIAADLHFSAGSLQWMLSAYTLTFASTMLAWGKICDVFHPKPVFCIGFAVIGLFSIPIAASVHPVMSIAFRSVQGLGAAMNIPSAMSLLRVTFPEPREQGRAYGAYVAAATIGNVAGFVTGGLITALASWRWVFYVLAMLSIPTSILSWFIIPAHLVQQQPQKSGACHIDFIGVSTVTFGLGLFVYSLSAGSDFGWESPRVITTLILSIVLCALFFVVEQFVPNPAVAPRTWSNESFLPLFFLSMSPNWWVTACEVQIIGVFMRLWHASALRAAVLSLPMGIAGLSAYLIGSLVTKAHHSVFLIGGHVLMAAASVLFALTDQPSKYWPYAVPGMIIGMLGFSAAKVPCTTLMMRGARKGEDGVVAALAFTAAQLGATLGVVVLTSITIGVNSKQPPDAISQHRGYAASFWSLVALMGLMTFVALLVRR